MSSLLSSFHQHEAQSVALSVQLNRWSQTMIRVLIQEQEQKLLASDLPVDDLVEAASDAEMTGRNLNEPAVSEAEEPASDDFWGELS